MDQREQFVRDWLSDEYTKVELCAGYGISRPTGDKWLARYHAHGVAGLVDLARRPHTQPHRTPDARVAAIVAMKHRHPSFGPKKIRDRLRAVVPEEAWPVDSTVGVLLKRAGWVRLGIRPERIRPGTPSENGRHERMHRALNAAVDRPPAMLGHNNAGSRRFVQE